ncbi:MAG: hypothetical protein ACRDCB_04210 [Clostridium sp.]
MKMQTMSRHVFSSEKLTILLELIKTKINSCCTGKNYIYYPDCIKKKEFTSKFRGSNERPEDFLYRIINTDELVDSKISDNFFLIVEIEMHNNLMKRANVQAFILEGCEIEEFFFEESYKKVKEKIYNNEYKIFYYRLDYHPNSLGRVFSETLPHVHTNVKGSPRFDLSHKEGDFVFEFLEDIYISHFYRKWFEWANTIMGPDDIALETLDMLYKKEIDINSMSEGEIDIICKTKGKLEMLKKREHILESDEKKRKQFSY